MPRGGFWRRPITRTYGYNLEVGEHYYSPMTSYLEAERGSRGETPGALTYSERLARRWIHGRRYDASEISDRYSRAASVARGEGAAEAAARNISYLETEMAARNARATSEIRSARAASELRAATFSRSQQTQQSQSSSSQVQSLNQQRHQLLSSSQQSSSSAYAARSSNLQQSESRIERRRVEDDISKKVADIRMMPWSDGQELNEAQAASARARARILELERELDEITRKALTSQTRALKTARQMAAEASLEDEANMIASTRKTRKVIMESSSKISQS